MAGALAGSLALTGCSSGGQPSQPQQAHPSWAKALGRSITIIPPAPTVPGRGSPGATVQGYIAVVKAKDLPGMCDFIVSTSIRAAVHHGEWP
jgi:hypothetical protein